MQNDKCTEFLQISNKECLFIFQTDQLDMLKTDPTQGEYTTGETVEKILQK